MSFFTEGLRQVISKPPQQKINAQNAKRIKLQIDMVLTEENLEGAPSEIMAAFRSVAAVSNGIVTAKIATEFEHVTITYQPLPEKEIAMEVKDAVIQELRVSRKTPKEGAPNEVTLHLAATVTYTEKLWKYLGNNGGATVYINFEQAQAVLQEEDAKPADEFAAERAKDVDATPATKKKAKKKAASVN